MRAEIKIDVNYNILIFAINSAVQVPVHLAIYLIHIYIFMHEAKDRRGSTTYISRTRPWPPDLPTLTPDTVDTLA
jgi:hypothetical protein